LTVGHGVYGAETLQVRPSAALEEVAAQVRQALARLVAEARDSGLAVGSPPVALAPEGAGTAHHRLNVPTPGRDRRGLATSRTSAP
jgi:hypothetical protein